MIVNFSDHAANERTFLAWVRTALAVVGFGLAVGKLDGRTTQPWTEIALLVAGVLVVALAFWRMVLLNRRIRETGQASGDTPAADALLIAIMASFLAMIAFFALHVI